MRRTWIFAMMALLTGSGACATSGSRPNAGRLPSSYAVTVVNDNWLDAVVYAVRGSARVRLGVVGGLGTTNLRIPATLITDGTFRMLVDPIGSTRTYTSDSIVVTPGQRIELTVSSNLSMSSFAVWNR